MKLPAMKLDDWLIQCRDRAQTGRGYPTTHNSPVA